MAVKLSSGFRALSAYKISMIMSDGDATFIEAWIQDNCEGEYYIYRRASSYSAEISFYLWDDTDVMAFKLRWM